MNAVQVGTADADGLMSVPVTRRCACGRAYLLAHRSRRGSAIEWVGVLESIDTLMRVVVVDKLVLTWVGGSNV